MNRRKYTGLNGALFLVLLKLQICAKGKVLGGKFQLINVILPLAIVAVCLFEYVLHSHSDTFREFQVEFLSLEWMLLACIGLWFGTFLFLAFKLNDLALIGFLLIAVAFYFISYATPFLAMNALTILFGAMLGKGIRLLLNVKYEWIINQRLDAKADLTIQNQKSEIRNFLFGLVMLLAFSSWWCLNISGNFYHGPRWMGLWYNPNIYGMLMGVGVVLAIELLAVILNSKLKTPKLNKTKIIFLCVAIFMITVGLAMSYSRGAWLGTVIGLLYLAKAHGKLKWWLVLPGIFVVAAVVFLFWHSTADSDAWYLKRLDLSRPSAQHRVSAWRGALQMMRDHPLGVGWNKAVGTYDKNYSPPEGGAAALTMNSYLMLGTELGIPGLVCFVVYVVLCLGSPMSNVQCLKSQPAPEDTRPITLDRGHWTLDSTQVTCRAAALMLLVAFWFDGGLFDLPTASVFWILLELGSEKIESRKRDAKKGQKAEADFKSEIGNRKLIRASLPRLL